MDKSVEKLKGIFGVTPDKSFTILYPQDDAAERAQPPDSALQGRYLERKLCSLASPTVAVVAIPVHEVDTDGRGHPTMKGTMTILKGLDERLPEDLCFSAELPTSRCPYVGVQGMYRFGCRTCAAKGERYPAPLEICSSCRTEMATYDRASKWAIFVTSLAGNSSWGPSLPFGGGEPTWQGVPRVLTWPPMRRDRETRLRYIGGCDARFKAGGHSRRYSLGGKKIPMEVRRLVPPHLFSFFLFFFFPRPAGPSLLFDPAPLPLPRVCAQSPGHARVGTCTRV